MPGLIYSITIPQMPEMERPRERMERLGPDALSDSELLALIIRSGRPQKSALVLATELLAEHGGQLNDVAALSPKELCRHDGIGMAKALEICAAFALARRLAAPSESRLLMNSVEAICKVMGEKLRHAAREEFHALLLDSKMRLMRDEVITTGLLDRTLVHPREVFRAAIREACKAIILCHNHPSGDPAPSSDDCTMTEMLVATGDIIGIQVIDHVIVGGGRGHGRFFSFLQENMINHHGPGETAVKNAGRAKKM